MLYVHHISLNYLFWIFNNNAEKMASRGHKIIVPDFKYEIFICETPRSQSVIVTKHTELSTAGETFQVKVSERRQAGKSVSKNGCLKEKHLDKTLDFFLYIFFFRSLICRAWWHTGLLLLMRLRFEGAPWKHFWRWMSNDSWKARCPGWDLLMNSEDLFGRELVFIHFLRVKYLV